MAMQLRSDVVNCETTFSQNLNSSSVDDPAALIQVGPFADIQEVQHLRSWTEQYIPQQADKARKESKGHFFTASKDKRISSALLASIVVLLGVDPWLAHSRGFALSCAATAGLILAAGPGRRAVSWVRERTGSSLLGLLMASSVTAVAAAPAVARPSPACPLASRPLCSPVRGQRRTGTRTGSSAGATPTRSICAWTSPAR